MTSRRVSIPGVVGDAPNRAFIVEYHDIQVLGSTAMLDLEVKLWENGTIDLLYGSNPVNPGDGRLATAGIENAKGTDALQIGFLERVLPSGGAIRITTVPDGLRQRHGHGRQRRPADRRRNCHCQPGRAPRDDRR